MSEFELKDLTLVKLRSLYEGKFSEDVQILLNIVTKLYNEKKEAEKDLFDIVEMQNNARLLAISDLKKAGIEVPEALKIPVTFASISSNKKKISIIKYAIEDNGKIRRWNGKGKKPEWFTAALKAGISKDEMLKNAKEIII